MKQKLFKIYRHSCIDGTNRQDENDLIASLVRIGYEVYLNDDYIIFHIGSDDKIEEE